MPNIANILKLEISRIARKEVRGETQGLKKAVTAYRTEIASLKRRSKDLEDQIRQLTKSSAKVKLVLEPEAATRGLRFSAKALASRCLSMASISAAREGATMVQ